MILVPSLKDVERNANSNAERRVARVLNRLDGGPDAVAFHSVKLRSHAYKQQAEADFVILWKGVVILVEVKGGGIRKYEGSWYSIDRRDDWHRLSSSPMEQAQSAMFALRDILVEKGLGWFAHEAIVVTPDIDAPPPAIEWSSSHWLANDDLAPESFTTALDTIVSQARKQPSGRRIARTEDLRTHLFGEFTRMPMIDAQRGAIIDEQNRATEGQARVLAALSRNHRVLVFGGAGTGKSLVLAEAAKQEADQDRSVLITFHSPALREFFAPHVHDRAIDILPFHELVQSKKYDVVLVDEAQDLMNAEGMDLLDGVIKGGRAGGRWRMFLDKNNQAHVDGRFDEDVMELVSEEAFSVDLSMNVRNTRAIVHMVQEYLGADVGDPGIVHGEKVQWHIPTAAGDVPAAEVVAESLIAEGVPAAEIWIISAASDAPPAHGAKGVVITSPRHAKGLEVEHVIVCDLPEVSQDAGASAFYVAVTRARVCLHLVASEADRRQLQKTLRQRLAAQ